MSFFFLGSRWFCDDASLAWGLFGGGCVVGDLSESAVGESFQVLDAIICVVLW